MPQPTATPTAAAARTDLMRRCASLRARFGGRTTGALTLLLGAAVLQMLAGLLPLFSWFTWPFLVFGCFRVLSKPGLPLLPASALQALARTLCGLRLLTLFCLLLYALVGLIVFRGLSEAFRLLPPPSLILPGATGTLLPFTFSEATGLLLVAGCATHLALGDTDELQGLSLAMRELLFSPLSWGLLLAVECLLLTPIAFHTAQALGQPLWASLLGHGPYALLALAWACGHQPASKTATASASAATKLRLHS